MDFSMFFKTKKLMATTALAVFFLVYSIKFFVQDYQNKQYIDSNFVSYSGVITNIEIDEPSEFIVSIKKDSVYKRKVLIELDSHKLFQSNLYFAMRKSHYAKINGLSETLILG